MFVLGLVLLQERQRQQSFDGNGYLFVQYLLIFLILAIATWRVTTQARGVVTLHVDLVSGCLFAARAGLQELTMTYKICRTLLMGCTRVLNMIGSVGGG